MYKITYYLLFIMGICMYVYCKQSDLDKLNNIKLSSIISISKILGHIV